MATPPLFNDLSQPFQEPTLIVTQMAEVALAEFNNNLLTYCKDVVESDLSADSSGEDYMIRLLSQF